MVQLPLLDIHIGTPDIIKYNYMVELNLGFHAMLEKRVEVDSSASWEKLFKIIESPVVVKVNGSFASSSNQSPDKGIVHA